MKDFKKEIKKLEDKIEELKRERDELEAMPDNQRLAELIHSTQCHSAHEDQCGWYYESWEKIGSTRSGYLDRANKILKETTLEHAIIVIKNL